MSASTPTPPGMPTAPSLRPASTSSAASSPPVRPERVTSLRLALDMWEARQARRPDNDPVQAAKMAALYAEYETLKAKLAEQQANAPAQPPPPTKPAPAPVRSASVAKSRASTLAAARRTQLSSSVRVLAGKPATASAAVNAAAASSKPVTPVAAVAHPAAAPVRSIVPPPLRSAGLLTSAPSRALSLTRSRGRGALLMRMEQLHGGAGIAQQMAAAVPLEQEGADEPDFLEQFEHERQQRTQQQQQQQQPQVQSQAHTSYDHDDADMQHELDIEDEILRDEQERQQLSQRSEDPQAPSSIRPSASGSSFLSRPRMTSAAAPVSDERPSSPLAIAASIAARSADPDPFAMELSENDEEEEEEGEAYEEAAKPKRATRARRAPAQRNATAAAATTTAPVRRAPARKAKRAREHESSEEEADEEDVELEGSDDDDEFGTSASDDDASSSGETDDNNDDDEDAPVTSLRRTRAARGDGAATTTAAEKKPRATRKGPRATKLPPVEKAKKVRTVVSTNYVRSDSKHHIKNGTGRAGKSGKALRAEKWRQVQGGASKWKSKAEYAREKKQQQQEALYCEVLSPGELAAQLAKSAALSSSSSSGLSTDAALLLGGGGGGEGDDGGGALSDHGTDDELERLKEMEQAQFGASSVRTKRDRAVEMMARAVAGAEESQRDAAANVPGVHASRRAMLQASNAALTSNILASRVDPTTHSPASLRTLLRSQFHYEDFRPGQLETIMRVLGCHQQQQQHAASTGADASSLPPPPPPSLPRSVLSILPTGGGKSLIYQVLSYLLPGLTLLVSPLLSLMKDQLEHLPPFLPGAIWSSELGPREVLALMTRLERGEIKVLFVSPEKLLAAPFQNFIKGAVCKRDSSNTHMAPSATAPTSSSSSSSPCGLSLVVVDEVHCMAEWSHNFRNAYTRLEFVLHHTLQVERILGLTATATLSTTRSVCAHLRVSTSPSDGQLDIVRAPLRRDNLILSVSQCTHESRFHSIAALLSAAPFKGLQSIIIYVSFQKTAEALSKFLVSQGGFGSTAFYHAGLTMAQRHSVQQRFMRNKLQIIVATCAFGMGLDKRDVRGVVHANLPRSLESYIQEVGRAGRDGGLAFCHTMFDASDETIARSLVYTNGVDKFQLNKLLGRIFEAKARADAEAHNNNNNSSNSAPSSRMLRDDADDDDDEDAPLFGSTQGEGDRPRRRQKLVYVALEVEHLRTTMDLSEEVVGTILARLERIDASASSSSSFSSSSVRDPWIRLVSCVHNSVSIGFHHTNPKVLAHSHGVVQALLVQNHWIQPPGGAAGAGQGVGISFDHERAATALDAAHLAASSAATGTAASVTPDYNAAEFQQLKQQKGFLTLNLIEAAMMLNMDVSDVQRDIVKLKSSGEISVQWSNLSFIVQVLRCPSDMVRMDLDFAPPPPAADLPGELTLDALVSSLHSFLQSQEASASTKLSIMSTTMKIAAVQSMRCSAQDAAQRARRITERHARAVARMRAGSKHADCRADDADADADVDAVEVEPDYFDLHLVMDAYFQAEDHEAFLAQLQSQLDEVQGQAATGSGGNTALTTTMTTTTSQHKLERELENDVSSFVRQHGDSLRSGREVARIFHGMHAPSAAAQGRSAESHARFQARRDPHAQGGAESGPTLSPWTGCAAWGRHKTVPFPQVLALCERILQEYKLSAGSRLQAMEEEAAARRAKKKQKIAQLVASAPAPRKPAVTAAPVAAAAAASPTALSDAAPLSTAVSSAASAAAAPALDDDVVIAPSDEEPEDEE